MSTMRRIALVLAGAAATTLLSATPAAAHGGHYCGGGTHLTSRVYIGEGVYRERRERYERRDRLGDTIYYHYGRDQRYVRSSGAVVSGWREHTGDIMRACGAA